MKALILAAGYATRLYPLTLNQPKPLLKVGKRTIADHILAALEKVSGVNQVFVVTNNKFSSHFEDWAGKHKSPVPIKVINDGTLTNETRLGAIGDINLVVNSQKVSEEMLVIAGDNLFDLDLAEFVKFAKSKKGGSAVALRVVEKTEMLKKYGVVSLDKNDRITAFEEKPEKPKSDLAAMCVYYFPKEKLALLDKYMNSGQSKDAPGNYIKWLSENDTVFGYRFDGEWFDIGDKASYEKADKIYKERGK